MPPTPVECAACPLSLASRRKCAFTQVRASAGELIFAQGQAWDRACFVREGLVALSVLGGDGSEREFAVRGSGTLLGVEALSGAVAAAEVRALTDVRLCVLSFPQFSVWVGNDSTPARAVMGFLLGELTRRAADRDWRSGTSESRVARLALAWADSRSSGDFPVRQKQQMARLLGMRAETFSRSLSRLASAGLLDAQSLRIRDRDRLEGLARAATA